jgi:hypothetical protein
MNYRPRAPIMYKMLRLCKMQEEPGWDSSCQIRPCFCTTPMHYGSGARIINHGRRTSIVHDRFLTDDYCPGLKYESDNPIHQKYSKSNPHTTPTLSHLHPLRRRRLTFEITIYNRNKSNFRQADIGLTLLRF